MAKRMTAKEAQSYRKMAADEFNLVWALLDKARRSRDEDETMVHAAHASRYHWSLVGNPTNLAIGEWQVSRVYAVLGRAEPCLHHARRCLKICEANRIGDFPLAFAYEALARADAVAGRKKDLRLHLAKAYKAGLAIAGKEDRDAFFRQLGTVARARKR